jgi:hypothetical protein
MRCAGLGLSPASGLFLAAAGASHTPAHLKHLAVSHTSEMEPFLPGIADDFDAYLRTMSQPGVWGGACAASADTAHLGAGPTCCVSVLAPAWQQLVYVCWLSQPPTTTPVCDCRRAGAADGVARAQAADSCLPAGVAGAAPAHRDVS